MNRKRCFKILQMFGSVVLIATQSVILGGCGSGDRPAGNPCKGFRIGVQSCSFRNFTVQEAIVYARKLGLYSIEICPGYFSINSSDEEKEALKTMLSINEVSLVAYGVCEFNSDSALARRYFEFARDMGIETLIVNPTPLELEFLERLAREFDVKAAIHNNGPQSRYDKLQDVLTAVAGRDPRIGACVDTECFLRSGEDPVKCIRTLGDRVFLIHLKDLKKKGNVKVPVIAGEGEINLKALFSTLKSIDYGGHVLLEYQGQNANPLSELELCLENIRKVLRKTRQ